jgi:hypothetical protein
MTKTLFAGIDPGLNGALVIIDASTDNIVFANPLPLIDSPEKGRKDIDCFALNMYLEIFKKDIHTLALEKVHSRPMQGVVSTFTFGRVYGKIMACLELLGLSTILVPPSVWTKALLPEGIKDKKGSIEFFKSRWEEKLLFPGKRKLPHDGIADAGCLAEYAKIDYYSSPAFNP